MDIESVATQMVVLFLLVIVGFTSHKYKLLDMEFDKKLSNFVIQITAPCLIISSTMGDEMPDRKYILPLIGIGIATYAILICLAYILPRCMPVRKEERGIYSFMLTFANVGFIGYPIVASIFGANAVFYACILNIPNTITIFIWGVMFVRGKEGKGFDWHLLACPSLIATYISILIVAMGWRSPTFIAQAFTLLGNMTVPATLLIIGSSIANMPIRLMAGNIGIYLMCVLRLLIIPVGIFYLIKCFGADTQLASINAVLVGMPVASFGTMFCLKYGKDPTLMTQGTFLSTLFAVLSIPLLALILS